jgi:hypothetical protein
VAYPAVVPSVIGVGATWDANIGVQEFHGAIDSTAVDRVAGYTQRHSTLLDILAPGGLINGTAGTSYSAPHVAAAVAIAQQMKQAYQPGNRYFSDNLDQIFAETGDWQTDGDNENDNVANSGFLFPRLNVEKMAYKLYRPAAPDLKNTSDWGFSETDDVTGDTTPTFEGTAPAGGYVWLYVGGAEVAGGQVTPQGTYSLESPSLFSADQSIAIRVASTSTPAPAHLSIASNPLIVRVGASETFTAATPFQVRMREDLVVSGVNSADSQLQAFWSTSPERSLYKYGTGAVTIPDPNNQQVSISNRTVSLTYQNLNGTTSFNVDTGIAATQSGETRIANWSVNAALGTGATSSNVVFNTTQNLAAISVVGNGAVAKLSPNGSRVLVVDNVAVSGGGKLDLYDNDLILKANAENEVAKYDALYTIVDSGWNNGTWTGPGVMSTTASGSPGWTSLGLVRNSQFSNLGRTPYPIFSGQLVGTNDILLKYTYRGDVDLNGLVENNDVSTLGAFYAPGFTGKDWWEGDLNYDGVVDNNDVTYQSANYNPNGIQL